MSGPLSDIVSLVITQDSVGVARAAFGTPLILSHTAAWAERTRTYSSILEVADDFAVDTPEYLAANAIFAQNPHPETVKIGRAANKPTMSYTVSATAANSTVYAIETRGVGFLDTDVTYTSDAAATVAEIHNGLVTALNAVTSKNYTAAFAALVYADDTFTAATTDICTNVAHGLLTGDGPFQLTSTGTLPAGLALATDYWIIKLDADTFKFASSLANALAGTPVDITDTGTGVHTISDTVSTKRPNSAFTVTGNAAGNWFSLGIGSASLLSILMDHADPGVATDLAAIAVEDDSWYMLYTLANSKSLVKGAADYIEAVKKMYLPDVCDTASLTVAYTDGLEDDCLAQLHTLAYTRVAGMYHQAPGDMAGAAWIGAVIAFAVGSATWAHKTLVGVSPTNLTSTHRNNLDARKANWYETTAGLNKTKWGYTADGGFIDTRMGIDWIDDDMTKSVFEDLAVLPKVPFTDDGVAIVENAVRGSLKRATDRGILSASPKFVVTVPLVKNVSTSNKSIRNLPDVKWSATLAGAIHKVRPINGVVSL